MRLLLQHSGAGGKKPPVFIRASVRNHENNFVVLQCWLLKWSFVLLGALNIHEISIVSCNGIFLCAMRKQFIAACVVCGLFYRSVIIKISSHGGIMNIRNKFLVPTLFVVAVSLIVFACISFSSTEKAIMNAMTQQSEQISESISVKVAQWIRDVDKDLKVFVNAPACAKCDRW